MIAVILFLFIGNSCKTLKVKTGLEKKYTIDDIQSKYKPNNGDFKSLSVSRMNINLLESGKEVGLRGNLRIVKDSALLVSLNAGLGIELVRAFLTQENIQVIDRINADYDVMKYSQIRSLVGIDADYQVIEKILLNSFSFSELVTLNDFLLYTDNEHIVIYDKESSFISGFDEARIYFRKQDLLVTKIELFDNFTKHFSSIIYGQFGLFDKEINVPQEIRILVNRGGEVIELVVKYLKVEIDSVKDLKFVVPSRYL